MREDLLVSSSSVPFDLRLASGVRPFVAARVNGVEVDLMVHSNASFSLMLTYEAADRVGLGVGEVERADYGISAVGSLGGRGRSSCRVESLVVGNDEVTTQAQVFELPHASGEERVQGMLGIGWLREREVVVDFRRSVLTPYGEADPGVPLAMHPSWASYVVDAAVDGRCRRWIVSTVAEILVQPEAALDLGLVLGERAPDDGGPTGTVVESRKVEGDWALELGGTSWAATPARTTDLYAYAAKVRPDDDDLAGILGCDFWTAHGAVLDFGRGSLALP